MHRVTGSILKNPECLPSSFPHYFTDPASLTSLGPSVSFPQNRHRRCTGPLKSAGHAFLLLRRWGSPVGDWIPDEPPNCEKHSVANNLGSGEDLSEVVIYSRLQWRAPHKQERAHLLVPKHSLYTFWWQDPPLFPHWVGNPGSQSIWCFTNNAWPSVAGLLNFKFLLTFLLFEVVMFLHLSDLTWHRDFHLIVLRRLVVCILLGRLLNFLITVSISQYHIPSF